MNNSLRYIPALLPLAGAAACGQVEEQRPNVLVVVADDLSWPHASAYGSGMVATPGFDTVAARGTLFANAYVTSPGSSPSRASILTGLYPWQIEAAGTHASSFSSDYECYPDLLRAAGYRIGHTGKGWAPGDWAVSGRPYNPAGPEYNELKTTPPHSGISRIDYAANFRAFLSERAEGQPFCFWIGTHEPHRPYQEGSWRDEGMTPEQAEVPGFLPDQSVQRGDLMDYAVEIEWADSHLTACIEELRRIGELDNTIIIVTADNGMSFPHAKANCYDAGLHVPLAICWSDRLKNGRSEEALVSSIDFAPTILEAAGVEHPPLGGRSLLGLMAGSEAGEQAVYAGRERHSFSRYNNMGYPMRSVRWGDYLLVHNFHPERWPAGDPQLLDGQPHHAYYDIDDAPSKSDLIERRDQPAIRPYFDAAMGAKRPEWELFDLTTDRACMRNLAADPAHADALQTGRALLEARLSETNDPRVGHDPELWERYPRLEGKSREFPEAQ